jgi:hypothetical protein
MDRGGRVGVIGCGVLPRTSFCEWRVSVTEFGFDAEINVPGSGTCHAEDRRYLLKIDVRALTISATVGAFLSIVLSLCCQRTRLAADTSKWTVSPSVLDACVVLMESADDEGVSGTAVTSPTWPPPPDDRLVPLTLSELLVWSLRSSALEVLGFSASAIGCMRVDALASTSP